MNWPRAVVSADLGPNAKLVALILSTHCRREGSKRVVASVPRLAAESYLSGPGVMRALAVLIAAGWIRSLDDQGDPSPLRLATKEYLLVTPGG